MNVRAAILQFLQHSEDYVSGEQMSRETGISRVAVWKHIKDLQEKGYAISSTPSKGYRLNEAGDFLFPWELTDLGYPVQYFPSCTSTMDEARVLSLSRKREDTVLISETQTQGRGREQRRWVSHRGGLYFTVVLHPRMSITKVPSMGYRAAEALASALREAYKIRAAPKWPNDVLAEGKKVAGVLVEFGGETDSIQYLHLGIGVNVNNPPPRTGGHASSLKKLSGRSIQRKEILKRFLQEFSLP
jgi:BirA family biotin operon repressor/biotin-[acetyl-CoA-carboxylase] ligase